MGKKNETHNLLKKPRVETTKALSEAFSNELGFALSREDR